MSTAFCAICVLAALAAAEPPGASYVVEEPDQLAAVESLVGEPEVIGGYPTATMPGVIQHGCQGPGLGFIFGTSSRMRWYTAVNGAYHRRPYNYLERFDYPWHPEPVCVGCPGTPVRNPLGVPLQAMPAPLGATDDAPAGEIVRGRPSAIRTVD